MKTVLIPGLGYNSRIFEHLNLSTFDIEYLNWIEPQEGEKIHDYAQRLFSKIKKNAQGITLIGHSLGGIVAQEIASTHQIEKVILISSIKSRKELPLSFKMVSPLNLHKLFTKEISIKTIKLWGKNHGFISNQDKDLFISMVEQQTNSYLQWALKELSLWHSPNISSRTELFQIHGTHDKTFPISLIHQIDFTIKNGSHIFVYKQADKVSEIIKSILMK